MSVMSPEVLTSIPVVLGTILVFAGLLSAAYELGGAEMERRGETHALDRRSAGGWVGILGAGTVSSAIAVLLAIVGGPVETALGLGLGLTFASMLREELIKKLFASLRDRAEASKDDRPHRNP